MRHFTSRLITSSRVRLAATYLSIIMVLSLGFSSIFYMQSIHEATTNLSRQSSELRSHLYFASPQYLQNVQDVQLNLFKKSLLKRLAVLNLGMLVLGGCISIVLAKRSIRPLEEALESQSRFTSDAAHELRTPLTAMKTEIEVALRSKKLSGKDAKDTLSSSLEEIAKLEVLTSALLRLARDSNNTDRTHWQNYKLSDILVAAKERLSEKAKSNKIDVKLPENNLTVFGDPDQLVELFVTVLGNAIKYSSEGSSVNIKAGKQGEDSIKVQIIDTGIGIAEVDIPHIFERFYRADQSRNKTKIDGYGLGLSLAKSIADSHDGKISVKSVHGKGSTFTIVLPK